MSVSVAQAETYTFVAKWGSYGSSDGQFKTPIGIDVDSLDNIYVADFGNHRIQKFDSNGNFITRWGSEGTGTGQFKYPRDVAVDSSDNVYVAEERNNRIQKFDSNGNFINQWVLLALATDNLVFQCGLLLTLRAMFILWIWLLLLRVGLIPAFKSFPVMAHLSVNWVLKAPAMDNLIVQMT
ncbi:6-bladed beta-propeller [Methanosarcina sp.]|uniref:6-bladed beta-propeller n=1 Tax=Methanosarcina sp. TaxID=2213 RepID=UPI003C779B3B